MDVIMPQLGETVEEGTVAAWHKKEGDKVAIDELLVEIETDKVATEVPSLVAGTVLKILVGVGETVKVGTRHDTRGYRCRRCSHSGAPGGRGAARPNQFLQAGGAGRRGDPCADEQGRSWRAAVAGGAQARR
jgi:hypothetical protein